MPGMEARRIEANATLFLRWRDQTHTVSLIEGATLSLGRDSADVVVNRPYVSREHADIVVSNGNFLLVDHSTNATFVRSEDEKLTVVKRCTRRLWGTGWISLGEPPTPENAIRFGHVG